MSRLILVDAGALEMALNALTRDCEKGMLARGEMVVEIRKTIKPVKVIQGPPPSSVAAQCPPEVPSPRLGSGLPRWEWSPPPDWDETKFNLDH